MLSPDGTIISLISEKRAKWYLSKGIAGSYSNHFSLSNYGYHRDGN